MKSDCGKSDFLKYPKMLKAWIRREKKYLETHPNCAAKRKFKNEYNLAFHDLFCDSYEEYETRVTGGLFPENAIDTKDYLENYFGIEL